MVKLNRSTKGAGPDARPPKVLSLAPAGRTLDTSHLGISPAYSILIRRRYAFAQPSLLSCTTIVESLSNSSSGTSGRLLMYWRSQENPTPVPHNRMNIASSKALGSSMTRYEQLYIHVLSRAAATPAVIMDRIEGITSRPVMASEISFCTAVSSITGATILET